MPPLISHPLRSTVILTPARDGMFCLGYLMGLIDAMQSPAYRGIIPMSDESDIPRGRGKLATLGLERTDADGFLFIDDDMHFTRADFELLAGAPPECTIVGGVYVKRRMAGGLCCNRLGEPHRHDAQLVTAADLGTGFLWIARAALEDLQKIVPRIRSDKGDWWHFFPNGAQPDGSYQSEDYGFCRVALEAGHQPWLHLGVQLGHRGTHVFRPRAEDFQPDQPKA